MKQFYRMLGVGLACLSVTVSALGADLLQVYRDALRYDPAFKAAESSWLMQRENIPIARASLLPHLSLGVYSDIKQVRADLGQNIQNIVQESSLKSSTHPYGYRATLEQPLFNLPAWFALKQAKAAVKQAQAEYFSSAQSLILRVAERYFAVLEAKDNLHFVQAEKKSVRQEYKRATARYKLGLATITAFYEAKARYDLMIAEEIAAKNNLSNRIEELREVTRCYYGKLQPVSQKLPLLSPSPTDIGAWERDAQRHNYSLRALRQGLYAAHETIRSAAAQHAPVLNAIGDVRIDKGGDTSTVGAASTETRLIGLDLSLPVLEGGRVVAQTRQARYNYQKLSDEYEVLLRRVVSQTRQSYLGVLATIRKIKADEKVIRSSRSALRANEAGYKTGTRTMNDVLDSQATLYRAEKDYRASLYQYLLNTLRLKQASGRLSANDLVVINSWLDIVSPNS